MAKAGWEGAHLPATTQLVDEATGVVGVGVGVVRLVSVMTVREVGEAAHCTTA